MGCVLVGSAGLLLGSADATVLKVDTGPLWLGQRRRGHRGTWRPVRSPTCVL